MTAAHPDLFHSYPAWHGLHRSESVRQSLPVGHRVDTMAGTDVEEMAFAWRNLAVPLVRRKLATEED